MNRFLFICAVLAIAVVALAAHDRNHNPPPSVDGGETGCVNVNPKPFEGGQYCAQAGRDPSFVPSPTPVPAVPPPATSSRYMATTDIFETYNMGCARGQRFEHGVIVLDFGEHARQGLTWGSLTYDPGAFPFRSLTEVENAVAAFANGYFDCLAGPNPRKLVIAVGVNNGEVVEWSLPDYYEHGRQWAVMINDLSQFVNGRGWGTVLSVAAANDMETSYNGPAETLAWAEGYDLANTRPYYNFGDAGGCSPISSDDDVGAAFPLPEIYLNDGGNAGQWQKIALYGVRYRGEQMIVSGAMTQLKACIDVGCPSDTDNDPPTGWRQMLFALNSHPFTRQEGLNYSTDIGWFE